MLRRGFLSSTPVLLTSAGLLPARMAGAQSVREPDDDGNVMPVRPRVARVTGLSFASADLLAAREGLRPTATALRAFGRGAAYRYQQQGYRARGALTAPDLALATLRTWGRPNRMDFVWFEAAEPLPLDIPGPAALAFRSPSDDPTIQGGGDHRSPVELAAVQAHGAALQAAARAHPDLTLLCVRCGWADENGARTGGLALCDARSQELYWSFLFESWGV